MADWRPLAVALVLDLVWGEPPSSVHPVVWMGRVLERLERLAPRGPGARLTYGVVGAVVMPVWWGTFGWWLERRLPWPMQAVLLKPTFAGRALVDAAARVAAELRGQRVGAAQQALTALVSRPTAELDASLASAAAVESVAENLGDSWVAPLLAYALGGLGGAYAYRAANTADAMWGYRTPRHEQLGKAAAKLDDVLSWAPSRVAAVLIVLASSRPRRALHVWRADAHRTASPNAGHPMAAAAGALDLRLEKRDHYVLNADAPHPAPPDIDRALHLARRAMLLAALVALSATATRSIRADARGGLRVA